MVGDSGSEAQNRNKFVVRTLFLPVLKPMTISISPLLVALLVLMQGTGFKISNLKAGVMDNYHAIIRK